MKGHTFTPDRPRPIKTFNQPARHDNPPSSLHLDLPYVFLHHTSLHPTVQLVWRVSACDIPSTAREFGSPSRHEDLERETLSNKSSPTRDQDHDAAFALPARTCWSSRHGYHFTFRQGSLVHRASTSLYRHRPRHRQVPRHAYPRPSTREYQIHPSTTPRCGPPLFDRPVSQHRPAAELLQHHHPHAAKVLLSTPQSLTLFTLAPAHPLQWRRPSHRSAHDSRSLESRPIRSGELDILNLSRTVLANAHTGTTALAISSDRGQQWQPYSTAISELARTVHQQRRHSVNTRRLGAGHHTAPTSGTILPSSSTVRSLILPPSTTSLTPTQCSERGINPTHLSPQRSASLGRHIRVRLPHSRTTTLSERDLSFPPLLRQLLLL